MRKNCLPLPSLFIILPNSSFSFDLIYLQSESNDFKALLHSVKLLFVSSVAHNVGSQLDVLVAEVPAQAGDGRGQRLDA